MAVFDRVEAVVKSVAPERLCDECLAGEAGLSLRQQANQHARRLAARPGFERRLGRCAKCGTGKQVTRYS